MLRLYREAIWDSERIPDGDLPTDSLLFDLRISKTQRIVDPATGKESLENTPLVRRAKSQGLKEEAVVERLAMAYAAHNDRPAPQTLPNSLPEGYSHSNPSAHGKKNGWSGPELLGLPEMDIIIDVSGPLRPASSMSWIFK